jgi:hypothetical protein
MEVYTVMSTPFAFGGLKCEIKTDIQEYERVDLGKGYFGIVFKNPNSKQHHMALECCGALIGTDKSKANLIKKVKNDIDTGDDKIMRMQINQAKIDLKGAKLLENEEWFNKFRG